MEMEMITQLIGSVGFPVAAFCMLFWFVVRQNESIDQMTEILVELKTLIKQKLNK